MSQTAAVSVQMTVYKNQTHNCAENILEMLKFSQSIPIKH